MSTTTTQTSIARNGNWQSQVLKDYELHHSQHKEDETRSQQTNTAPVNHQLDAPYRRVPAYRPLNRERDQSEVRVYTSSIERAFITVMFGGLYLNAGAAQLWRGSIGKVTDRVFRYPIGGEL
ncbi:hypothetical protein NM208_g609 [Fusarium decemcellulare]|uniref:Uncharacterized protein n=1 Tax=Fusarium decemcellulare TaxID=57161 RepID=A0ACC1SZ40_9HYPO|nr:hypothetical protein NM208_g609 [Fusarium decemcellulare]